MWRQASQWKCALGEKSCYLKKNAIENVSFLVHFRVCCCSDSFGLRSKYHTLRIKISSLMPLSNCVFVICVEIVKGMLCTRLGNKWKTRIGMFATFGSRFFPWLFHADESSVPTSVAQVILLCACVKFRPRRALLFVDVTSFNPLSRNIRIHAYVLCFEWSLSFRTSHKTLIHTVSGFCVHPYGGPPKEGIHAILWKDNCNEKRLQLDLSMLRGQ